MLSYCLRRIPSIKSLLRSMSTVTPIFNPLCKLSEDLTEYSSGSIPVSSTELNLRQTLLGGQSFRWTEESNHELVGVVRFYIIRLKHVDQQLHYKFYINAKETQLIDEKERQMESSLVLENYFQLTVKLSDLWQKWSLVDKRFANGHVPMGIRVLAQEPLENLISFICSSNNNVQRITKMIQLLCEQFGEKIGTIDDRNFYQFPTIDQLDRTDLEKHLRELNFGYRARYIQQAIKYLKNTINDPMYFDRLKTLSVKDARIELLKIMGIGRKVADCILLMSLGKQNVVPVDTHIHSIATTHYGYEKKLQLTTAKYDDISSFFERLWQPLAGWAQSAAFSNELRGLKVPLKSRKRVRETNVDCPSVVPCRKRNRSSK